MRAAVVVDGAIRLEDRPIPTPGSSEISIRVRTAGLNGADQSQLRAGYPLPPDAPPDIPGLEAAGTVVAVGADVRTWWPGQDVIALVGGGAHAEYVLAHEAHVLERPPAIGWDEAGGFIEAFATAHDALFGLAELTSGERLLVQGAAGGVGIAALQIAREAGARIVATVRSPAPRKRVAELGVEVRSPGDLDDRRFDVILELVGGDNLAHDVHALAIGGRLVVVGVNAGSSVPVDFRQLMRARGRIIGSTLRMRTSAQKGAVVAAVRRDVLPLWAARRITVPVDRIFPLADVGLAYAAFRERGKLGKLVLSVSGDIREL